MTSDGSEFHLHGIDLSFGEAHVLNNCAYPNPFAIEAACLQVSDRNGFCLR